MIRARHLVFAPLLAGCALFAADPPASPGGSPPARPGPARYGLASPESQGAVRSSGVSIVQGKWRINGKVTYPGTRAEGLLMNVRMVNAVFEDRNDTTRPQGFDPDANTDAFIRQIPTTWPAESGPSRSACRAVCPVTKAR